MGQYADQVKNHAAVQQLKNAIDLINNIMQTDPAESHLEHLDRINNVLLQTRIIINNTDPYFISPSTMDNIHNNAIIKIANNLSTYLNNRQLNHLHQCINVIDGYLLGYLASFIYPKTGKEVTGYKSAAESYKKLVNQYMGVLRQQQSELSNSIRQAAAAIESNVKESSQETMELFDKIKDDHQDLRIEMLNKSNELISSIIEKKNEYSNVMEKHIKDIENIVGAVSERSIIYGFQKNADDEKMSKETWQKGTVWSIILLVVYSITVSVISFFYPFTWENIIPRLSGLLPIGILITYCARNAASHALNERYNRKMELELASLGPYFAGVDEGKLFDIRKELAMRFFGNEVTGNQKSKDVLELPQDKLLDILVELIKKIKN